jgi:hypothetical protein
MSSDPVRWLEDEEASGLERQLVRSAGPCEPPAGAEDRIWGALALRLPPGDGGGSGGAEGLGAGAGALGTLGALKSAGIGAVAGLLVAGAASFADSPPPRQAGPTAPTAVMAAAAPEVPKTAAAAVSAPPPAAAAPSAPGQRAIAARQAERAPISSVGSLADHSGRGDSQLREESRALQAVRDALRRGDAVGALATLEATRARHPASVLGQEREALTIQALARAGQRDAARSRARAFLEKFPTSPHAESLARFAAP